MHTSFLLLSCCSSSPALPTLFLCSSYLSFHSISLTCSVLFHPSALALGISPAWQTAPGLHMTSSFSTFHPHFKDQVPAATFLGFHIQSSLSLSCITHPVYFLIDVITVCIILFAYFLLCHPSISFQRRKQKLL